MKTRVSKTELLDVLQKNRESHRTIFLEAQEGYRQKVITSLDEMLAEARGGKRRSYRLYLSEPEDHTKDYDTVIRMITMSQDETIELDDTAFTQFVMDDWQWKRQFLHANSVYSATAMRLSSDEGDD